MPPLPRGTEFQYGPFGKDGFSKTTAIWKIENHPGFSGPLLYLIFTYLKTRFSGMELNFHK